MQRHDESVLAYLARLYDEGERQHACRAETPAEVATWQRTARPALRHLIGLERIAASVGDHRPTVELGPAEELDGYTRQHGQIEAEPHISIPFWLLKPKGEGPFPLALMPHGHSAVGYHIYAGIAHDEETRRRMIEEDRDVAVQAVREGFLAIAPATRGLGCNGVPDINGRHGDRDCRSQLLHCLLAGRTPLGERVWDMMRLLDWATALPEVDPETILMMGNSGGGVATIYTAACDTRITIAVPSCSFAPYVSQDGLIHHCDCNAVPGILRFGEMHDVAGLIAPRHLLIVNGRQDPLFAPEEVDRAVAGLGRIYRAAGAEERFQHRYGEGGHRFYKDLMWPFIRLTMGRIRAAFVTSK